MLRNVGGSGLHAPARFLVGFAIAAALAGPALGQTRGQRQQPSARPAPARPAPAQPAAASAQLAIPDALTVAKLIWTTLAAVDHANATGNYSVLRDLGAPSFQANNNAATLASVFQSLRTQRVDLSNTLLVSPNFEIGPTIQDGLLRVRGVFPLRPTGIGFDLLFQPVQGRWALFGIALVPVGNVAPATPPRR
jgi:hypothetical protein